MSDVTHTTNPVCSTTPADQIALHQVKTNKKKAPTKQPRAQVAAGKAAVQDHSSDGRVGNMSNAGGKVLIGNYAEERYVNETLGGPQLNYNEAKFNGSFELRGGNMGAVAPQDKTMYHTSTNRSDFAPPPASALSGEYRLEALVGMSMCKLKNQGLGLS